MRLNKFIALTGLCSRRQADELITNGQVVVNGNIVDSFGTQVDPKQDQIFINGKLLKIKSQKVVYLLNKPRGVVTTASDPEGRKTVLDFVPDEPRVFPCGRLDIETMGLVLLTNDGNLCYQLTHPKFEHQKEYFVQGTSSNPEFSWEKLQKDKIRLGVQRVKIDNRKLKRINGKKIDFWLTIHEGKYHVVRKLCGAVGVEILQLTRVKLGHYELGNIKLGHYKKIEHQEK